MAVPAWAETPTPADGDCSASLYQEGAVDVQNVTAAAVNNAEKAKQILLEGLLRVDEEIDFTGSGVYYERDIRKVYAEVINDNPELFYVDGSYSVHSSKYDRDRGDWYDFKLTPHYTAEMSQIPQMRQEFADELNRILAYAASGSTPLMKALLVNDYFCVNYEYDTTYRNRNAYNLFIQKTGVCQAYMLGYKAALKALGIPVKTAQSDAMNHTWNLVQIDGEWYHVDTTWNDPVPNRPGRARHCYFMRSDAGFLNNSYANPHYDWEAEDGIKAVSNRFDDAIWCDVDRPVVVSGNAYYIIRGSTDGEIVKVTDSQSEVIHRFSTCWRITTPENSGYYRDSCYSTLNLYRGYLVYTAYDEVCALSLKDGSVTSLYSAPKGLGIWQADLDGGVLHYGLGQDYNKITNYGDLVLNLNGTEPVGDLLAIPEKTTVIDSEAFSGTKVRNLVCGETLRRIESLAFADCTALETVRLGAGVTYIADNAFRNCQNVTFLCPRGSYAENYAVAHGFAVENP